MSTATIRRSAPGRAMIAALAVSHTVLTLVGYLVILVFNLTPCSVPGEPPHLLRAVLQLSVLGAFGLGIWAILASRWHRPWLLLAGGVAATPALLLAAEVLLAPPDQFCP